MISPLGVPHCTTEDTELLGYKIPARTMVMSNFYAALRDPKHFPDPETFKPERFIGKDGTIRKYDAFLPFGIGMIFLCFNILLKR